MSRQTQDIRNTVLRRQKKEKKEKKDEDEEVPLGCVGSIFFKETGAGERWSGQFTVVPSIPGPHTYFGQVWME